MHGAQTEQTSGPLSSITCAWSTRASVTANGSCLSLRVRMGTKKNLQSRILISPLKRRRDLSPAYIKRRPRNVTEDGKKKERIWCTTNASCINVQTRHGPFIMRYTVGGRFIKRISHAGLCRLCLFHETPLPLNLPRDMNCP
jgi:hypothetical protein